MKPMTEDELRITQLGILDYFVSICEKNDLLYWINYGTLLGAVRHKGFIPWDDDIDVTMLREDYEKLVSICRNDGGRYRFSCVENDKECMYPFGKFIDDNTILFEAGEDGIRTGVYIDVFVYDNAPVDADVRKKAYAMLDFYGHYRKYQLPMKPVKLSLKRLAVLFLRMIISLLPRQFFTRKIVESAKKFCCEESEYVCDMTDPFYYSQWMVEKTLFTNQTDIEFEGKMYKAPLDYNKWLSMQYGDYMKMPSVEEQKLKKHDIQAYFKEDD